MAMTDVFDTEREHDKQQSSSDNEAQPVGDSRSWLPIVDENLRPTKGMLFSTLDEAEFFYKNYASKSGFQVRRGIQRTDKNKDLIWKRFLCNKEGQRDKSRRNPDLPEKRRRLDTREGCEAKIEIGKNTKQNFWNVVNFVEQHTHPFCTPKKRHLQKTHRSVDTTQRSLMQTFSSCNISTTQTVSVLGEQAGGLEFMGCTERDVRNTRRDMIAELEGNDIQNLLSTFEQRKEENPSFFYEYVLEEETNKLLDLFWADGTQRVNYTHFHDVVVFDTTYLTNRYSLPFSAFTGINHHGQSIYLGQAFIHTEHADSYMWLFKTWLKAMPGPPPTVIITDQDRSIAKAIRIVMPTTYHRLCIWHITFKLPEKVGPVVYHRDMFSSKFHDCLKYSETPKEFEGKWLCLMEEYGLKDHEWLNEMYEIRESWVTTYMKDIFFAGLTSSQRSESQNSALKHYVSSRSSFSEFFMRFDTANRRMRHHEKEADYTDFVGKPRMKTDFEVEKKMSEIYTLFIFYQFQEELCDSLKYIHKIERDDEHERAYSVKKFEKEGIRRVVFNKITGIASCSCKKFEFEWIVCRHILYIFRQLEVSLLPKYYIKKRWTKKAKEGSVVDDDGGALRCENDGEIIQFRCRLGELGKEIMKQGSVSREAFELAEKGQLQIIDQLSALNIGDNSEMTQPFSRPSILVNEPDQARHKGCGRRMKGGREKAMPKPRVCHGCNKKNVKHDKRNCPSLKENTLETRDTEDNSNDHEPNNNSPTSSM